MTDLADTIGIIADHIDRVGITHADVISVCLDWSGAISIHVKAENVGGFVASHGDMSTQTTVDHMVGGVLVSHHHHVSIIGTGGKMRILWITDATPAIRPA